MVELPSGKTNLAFGIVDAQLSGCSSQPGEVVVSQWLKLILRIRDFFHSP